MRKYFAEFDRCGGNVDEERESRGVDNRTALVPLAGYQRNLLDLLARNRSSDSYLAGGAALHFSPNSARFSDELDFFHDSSARVASAFAEDSASLEGSG